MTLGEQKIVQKTEGLIKNTFSKDATGHDYFHILRVVNNARKISRFEESDDFVVVMGALLHEMTDWKLTNALGMNKIEKYLVNLGIGESKIKNILHIIKFTSYSSIQPNKKSSELKIVQDADRLDALGAIGIARTFAYGGKSSRPIYNPAIKPANKIRKKDYRKRVVPSINHFYEKLLRLKDLMNTETGREMAAARHKFLLNYLKEFFLEWEGKR